MVEFYIIDEEGNAISDSLCGCLNGFSTMNKAIKQLKIVSKKYQGKFSVAVAISTIIYENGNDITDSIL